MFFKRHKNIYPHEPHGITEVLRWKLFGSRPAVHPFEPPLTHAPIDFAGSDQITWIGHSSFLVSFAGSRILADPVFSEYCAPLALRRFRRTAPPGIGLESAGDCDFVLITHNHYDHLDRATILRLKAETRYFVPAGLSHWFSKLGRTNVLELNWWDSAEAGVIKLTCIPSQHFSSRTLWDRDTSLWCGWLLEAGGIKVYFVGDSGYCPLFKEVGERFGPIDLAVIPIGAYEPRWFMKPMHVNPEEAIRIHLDVRSKQSVACHWGTFCLTDEPMSEPPKRLREALLAAGLKEADFSVLKIGQTAPIRSSVP